MDEEIRTFLLRHLKAVEENDLAAYRETTAAELSLYEWWVTPHRIEGLPFHEFMLEANAQRGAVFGSEARSKAADALRPGQPVHPALRRCRHRQLYAAGQHGSAGRRCRWFRTMRAGSWSSRTESGRWSTCTNRRPGRRRTYNRNERSISRTPRPAAARPAELSRPVLRHALAPPVTAAWAYLRACLGQTRAFLPARRMSRGTPAPTTFTFSAAPPTCATRPGLELGSRSGTRTR